MFIARYCDLLNVVISCDGCERMAPWHRYRCLQCMDMDLCKTCFLSEFTHTLLYCLLYYSQREMFAQSLRKQGKLHHWKHWFAFLTRWRQTRGSWGRPWDGEHGVRLRPLPGAHCGQQDQLQCVWRLWPVLRLLQCKEVSWQVTHFQIPAPVWF